MHFCSVPNSGRCLGTVQTMIRMPRCFLRYLVHAVCLTCIMLKLTKSKYTLLQNKLSPFHTVGMLSSCFENLSPNVGGEGSVLCIIYCNSIRVALRICCKHCQNGMLEILKFHNIQFVPQPTKQGSRNIRTARRYGLRLSISFLTQKQFIPYKSTNMVSPVPAWDRRLKQCRLL